MSFAGVSADSFSGMVVWAAVSLSVSSSEPSSPIMATVVPTATVSPSWNNISRTFPATGEGISALTLAVLTSKSTSSSLIESPVFTDPVSYTHLTLPTKA